MIVPFKNYGNLTQTQIDFNYIHSATRIVIENAFSLLKGRFRRLHHFTEQIRLTLVVKIITAACVLHNICIEQNDLFDVDEILPNEEIDSDDDDYDGENVYYKNQLNRRDELVNELVEKSAL